VAGSDRVALDVTGIRCLQSIPGCSLTHDPWSYRQISHAVELGLGATSDNGFELTEESAADEL
jgi:hypothetical protein